MIQVFNENFIDVAFDKTVSSEQAAYPASNVYDIARRRKPWRSAGYWLVESGKNTIKFTEEALQLDLTATITPGEYTSETTFFAAIKSALEATGDATYTVSRDSTTGKIKILSDLSGSGTTLFTINWPAATDFGDILGFDTSVISTGAAFYLADEIRIHTEEFFIFDFGAPMQPTGFFAVSDRNRPINISPTATVTLMANASNAWGTPAETFTITVRDFLLGYINVDGIAQLQPAGYRYWKVKIIDNDNPDTYLELGAMLLGAHAEMERGCPAFPFESNPVNNSVVGYSESGQTWVGKRPKTILHSLMWEKLTNADMDVLMDFWEDVGCESPFFVCLDPNSVFSPDGIKWSRLVRFNSEPSYRLLSPGNWSSGWALREEL